MSDGGREECVHGRLGIQGSCNVVHVYSAPKITPIHFSSFHTSLAAFGLPEGLTYGPKEMVGKLLNFLHWYEKHVSIFQTRLLMKGREGILLYW